MARMELARRTQGLESVYFYQFVAIGLVVGIILFGSFQRAQTNNQDLWLGVETAELNPALKEQYGITVSNGVLVTRAFVGSPAEAAGLKTGDIIQRWDGISIKSPSHIQWLIRNSVAHQRITLSVSRNDKPVLIYVKLDTRPGVYLS